MMTKLMAAVKKSFFIYFFTAAFASQSPLSHSRELHAFTAVQMSFL